MTAKSAFTDEEWQTVEEAPATAGLMLVTAASGGTFRETIALARAYADARGQHEESQLLDEIVSSKPEFDRHRYGTAEELHTKGLELISRAVELVREKATPQELADYEAFIITVATKVAEAHKEDGQVVSPPEQEMLDAIRAQLA